MDDSNQTEQTSQRDAVIHTPSDPQSPVLLLRPGVVFISHEKTDDGLAREIRAHLEAGGFRCWMAPDDIAGPMPWPEQINRAIAACDVMLVIVSANANSSTHVSREVDIAVETGKPLLPVRVADIAPTGSLDYLLRLAQWIDLFPGSIADHASSLQSVVASMLSERGLAPRPTEPPPTSPSKPPRRRWYSRRGAVVTGAVAVVAVVAIGVGLALQGNDDNPSAPSGALPSAQTDGDSSAREESGPIAEDDDGAGTPAEPAAGGTGDQGQNANIASGAVLPDVAADVSVTFALANGGEGGHGPNFLCTIEGAEVACDLIDPEALGGQGVAAADFNNDGRLDLAFVVLHYVDDAGTMQQEPSRVCLGEPQGWSCSDLSDDELNLVTIAAGDLDEDGNVDVMIGGYPDIAGAEYGGFHRCIGDGTGAFDCKEIDVPGNNLGAVMGIQDIVVADVDGDGHLDALLGASGPNQLCLGDGTGSLTCSEVEAEPSGTNSAAIGDFDENRTLDVYFANFRTPNRMCLGNGAGGFECIDVSSPDNPSTAAAVGDVNGDGHLDVLVGQGDPMVYRQEFDDQLCLGDGTGVLVCSTAPSPSEPFVAERSTSAVLLADVDDDGNLDYFSLGLANSLCLGDGDGDFECVPLDLEYRDERGFGTVGGFTGIVLLD